MAEELADLYQTHIWDLVPLSPESTRLIFVGYIKSKQSLKDPLSIIKP